MKKIILSLASVLIVVTAFSQNTPGVQALGNNFNIVTYNPNTQSKVVLRNYPGIVKSNSMAYDNENNKIILVKLSAEGKSSIDIYSSISGVLMNSFPVNRKIVGGVYMPSNNSYGVFSVQSIFNYYGNNQEDINFISIDINSGRELYNKSMNSVSVVVDVLPFYAKQVVSSPNTPARDFSISSMAYLPKQNQVVFCATDVSGSRRMFRIDASNGNILAKQAVYHNVLDLTYNHVKDELKAIAFEIIESQINLYAITLSQDDLKSSDKIDIIKLDYNAANKTIIYGSSIEFDLDHTYYISQPRESSPVESVYLFSLDANSQSLDAINYSQLTPQFNYGFEQGAYTPMSFLNAAQVYPNPTFGPLNIEMRGLNIKGITITDVNGRVVKKIGVEGAFKELSLDVSEFITGVYFLRIETQSNPIIKKFVVQP
jgi:hypothetical protein